MYLIKLNTIELVKKIVDEVASVKSDIFVKSRNSRYVVDAKSIMGILSLNLLEQIVLEINGEEPELINKLKEMNIIIGEIPKTN